MYEPGGGKEFHCTILEYCRTRIFEFPRIDFSLNGDDSHHTIYSSPSVQASVSANLVDYFESSTLRKHYAISPSLRYEVSETHEKARSQKKGRIPVFLVIEESNQLTPISMVRGECSISDEVVLRDDKAVPILIGGREGEQFIAAWATIDGVWPKLPNNQQLVNMILAGVRVGQKTPDPIRKYLDQDGLVTDAGRFVEMMRPTVSLRASTATPMDTKAFRDRASEIRTAISAMERDIKVPHMALLVNSMYRFTLPPGTILERNRDYFIVFDASSGGFQISSTASGAEDAGNDPRWSMPSIGVSSDSSHSGGAWRNTPDRIIRLAIRGEVLPATDEHAGLDFPGAGYNAHKTLGYVTPGIVSNGHLTAGLDRDQGHTGDYWHLDTKRGHSYRVEVKFGNSSDIDTGGSAWIYFIDGDRRGSCCDSDHNRDDGHTLLHVKHDQKRRYLVYVAAFDQLNTGSAIYNGPYTITMTDITGTEKATTNLYLGTRTDLSTVGSSRQYAVSFRTGHQDGGYELDRIDTHISNGNPSLALHADTSFAPGDKVCDFRNPSVVQHRVYTRVVPFLAPDCAGQRLAPSTTYWIVFAGTNYKPKSTDTDNQLTRRGGWSIGNTAVTKTTGAWSNLSSNGTIPVAIWARQRHPAQGRPLARGERKVGEILTADIGGITDADGLTNPLFEYQWQRVDGGTPADIAGEMSDTYTLTDDDAGTRIRLRVTFRDDSNSQETLTGPATSLIVPEPRVLVSNLGQSIGPDTPSDYSSGFVTGTHELGYAIDSIELIRSNLPSAPSASAEFRLYTSTSSSNPLDRKPSARIMAVNGPDLISGTRLTFGTPCG